MALVESGAEEALGAGSLFAMPSFGRQPPPIAAILPASSQVSVGIHALVGHRARQDSQRRMFWWGGVIGRFEPDHEEQTVQCGDEGIEDDEVGVRPCFRAGVAEVRRYDTFIRSGPMRPAGSQPSVARLT